MRHRDMRHAAGAEERAPAHVRPVDELIDQHETPGRHNRTDCTTADQTALASFGLGQGIERVTDLVPIAGHSCSVHIACSCGPWPLSLQ